MTEAIRTALAAAASTVDGVHVTAYYRQVPKTAGQGMVRLDRTTYPDPFGGITTWQVLVALPQDEATAEKWLEAHQDDLYDAVSEELMIRTVIPKELIQRVGSENVSVPVVVIEGERGPE